MLPLPVQLPALHQAGEVTVDVSTEKKTDKKVLIGATFVHLWVQT